MNYEKTPKRNPHEKMEPLHKTFLYAKVDLKTGNYGLSHFDPRDLRDEAHFKELFESSQDTARVIFPDFPSVYSPLTHILDDHETLSSVFNEMLTNEGLRDGDNVLDSATGTGFVAWLEWAAATRRGLKLNYYAYDINPLAVANARVLAEAAGIPLKTMVSDKITAFGDTRFKFISSDAPMKPNVYADMHGERNIVFSKYWDHGAPGLFYLNDFIQNLHRVVAPGFVSVMWNTESLQIERSLREAGFDIQGFNPQGRAVTTYRITEKTAVPAVTGARLAQESKLKKYGFLLPIFPLLVIHHFVVDWILKSSEKLYLVSADPKYPMFDRLGSLGLTGKVKVVPNMYDHSADVAMHDVTSVFQDVGRWKAVLVTFGIYVAIYFVARSAYAFLGAKNRTLAPIARRGVFQAWHLVLYGTALNSLDMLKYSSVVNYIHMSFWASPGDLLILLPLLYMSFAMGWRYSSVKAQAKMAEQSNRSGARLAGPGEKKRYFAMFKPGGVVSHRAGANDVLDVYQLLHQKTGEDPLNYYHTGRLDQDVPGLMVFSNDPDIVALHLPVAHVSKTYRIKSHGVATEQQLRRLREGVMIESSDRRNQKTTYQTKPAVVDNVTSEDGNTVFDLSLTEGKYHQVKDMIGTVMGPNALIHFMRVRVGELELGKLGLSEPGQVVELTGDALKIFLRIQDKALGILQQNAETQARDLIKLYVAVSADSDSPVSKVFAARKIRQLILNDASRMHALNGLIFGGYHFSDTDKQYIEDLILAAADSYPNQVAMSLVLALQDNDDEYVSTVSQTLLKVVTDTQQKRLARNKLEILSRSWTLVPGKRDPRPIIQRILERSTGARASEGGPALKQDGARLAKGESLKVGMVGLGTHGKRLLRTLMEISERPDAQDLQIDAVARGSFEEVSQTFSGAPRVSVRKGDAAEVLTDASVKAVIIATPARAHYEMVKKALESGKDVFVEKPFTLRSSEAEELVDLAKKKGLILMVGHTFLYSPVFKKLREIVSSGALGEIRSIEAKMLNPLRPNLDRSSNVTEDLGDHFLYMIQNLLNGAQPKILKVDSSSSGETARLQLGYRELPVSVEVSREYQEPQATRTLSVKGEAFTATFDFSKEPHELRIEPTTSVFDTEKLHRLQSIAGEAMFERPLGLELKVFLESVKNREQPPSSGGTAVAIVSAIEEINARQIAGARLASAEPSLGVLLDKLSNQKVLGEEEIRVLTNLTLADPNQKEVFGLTEVNAKDEIRERISLFQKTAPAFKKLMSELKIEDLGTENLWSVYVPLSLWLYRRKLDKRPEQAYIVGFSGGLGVGKTTRTKIIQMVLEELLRARDEQVVTLSIDDFYKTKMEREALRSQGYVFRGPPGTHDVGLALSTLRALRDTAADSMVYLPVFDKAIDDRSPETKVVRAKVGIVLFEGWFVGADTNADTSKIPEGFKRRVAETHREYGVLNNELDDLIVRSLRDLDAIKAMYRDQVEKQRAKAAADGKQWIGLRDDQIEPFVEYLYIDSWQAGVNSPEPRIEDTSIQVITDDHRQIIEMKLGGRAAGARASEGGPALKKDGARLAEPASDAELSADAMKRIEKALTKREAGSKPNTPGELAAGEHKNPGLYRQIRELILEHKDLSDFESYPTLYAFVSRFHYQKNVDKPERKIAADHHGAESSAAGTEEASVTNPAPTQYPVIEGLDHFEETIYLYLQGKRNHAADLTTLAAYTRLSDTVKVHQKLLSMQKKGVPLKLDGTRAYLTDSGEDRAQGARLAVDQMSEDRRQKTEKKLTPPSVIRPLSSERLQLFFEGVAHAQGVQVLTKQLPLALTGPRPNAGNPGTGRGPITQAFVFRFHRAKDSQLYAMAPGVRRIRLELNRAASRTASEHATSAYRTPSGSEETEVLSIQDLRRMNDEVTRSVTGRGPIVPILKEPLVLQINADILPEQSFDFYAEHLVSSIETMKRKSFGAQLTFQVVGQNADRLLSLNEVSRAILTKELSPALTNAKKVSIASPAYISSDAVNLPVRVIAEGEIPAFEAEILVAIHAGTLDLGNISDEFMNAYATLAGERPSKEILREILTGKAPIDVRMRFALKPLAKVSIQEAVQFFRLMKRMVEQAA